MRQFLNMSEMVRSKDRLEAINRTKQIRLEANETAAEFGGFLGTSGSTIHRWENHADDACPSARHLFLMCHRLNKSPSWVIFGIGPKNLSDLI
jgi:transcriptional regulator with XRE-family HTH domain